MRWIFSTMSAPTPATSGASTWAMTSYSPVIASDWTMPSCPDMCETTSIAFPGWVLMST